MGLQANEKLGKQLLIKEHLAQLHSSHATLVRDHHSAVDAPEAVFWPLAVSICSC
jgi:hypothetical protein